MDAKREIIIVAAPAAEGEPSTHLFVADRADREEVKRQASLVSAQPLIALLFNSMTSRAFVLNAQRQIVYVNRPFQYLLDRWGLSSPLGKRFGELFNCVNASRPPAGCGTTEACRSCGAALAMKTAFQGGLSVKEFRLRTGDGAGSTFKMSASPIDFGGEAFFVCTLAAFQGEMRPRPINARQEDHGRCPQIQQ